MDPTLAGITYAWIQMFLRRTPKRKKILGICMREKNVCKPMDPSLTEVRYVQIQEPWMKPSEQ